MSSYEDVVLLYYGDSQACPSLENLLVNPDLSDPCLKKVNGILLLHHTNMNDILIVREKAPGGCSIPRFAQLFHVEPYALALELNFTDAHPYLKRLLALDLLASLVIVYFSKGVFELTAASVPARGLGGSGTTVGLPHQFESLEFINLGDLKAIASDAPLIRDRAFNAI
ncbi:predicted protein [Aspergillus nidulans FGSC A4]|uniref:Uncharacterized protein n=1 Tax=Emericella nidulans (strain FGSC A4 / ATCC 38163 / CBS 112.46 / NRRL 194 / M139) TaxID=227321 RepID=Q5AQV9_EMENI|nr:hypothetical protein [Aspergillus nidulans FGSC A4]EAA66388.1 predicted protein [Aspergillus nidulans FGSC A4]CBF87398.1 TPA: hypothetical protein ANIA_09321 [Aspergillus nidulans FGSC A4]|eukprot:XP_682590.1 predicted protein [Aspergillus nidulans FGSC A4]